MAKNNCLEYIARLSGAVITLVLLMFVVLFVQIIVVELSWMYKKPSLPIPPDSPEWRIPKAEKLFLPDGTVHFVNKVDTQSNDNYAKEEITDVNGLVLWHGIHKDRPSRYLDWASPAPNFYGQQMQSVSGGREYSGVFREIQSLSLIRNCS